MTQRMWSLQKPVSARSAGVTCRMCNLLQEMLLLFPQVEVLFTEHASTAHCGNQYLLHVVVR